VLARYSRAYAQEAGVAERRVRAWVAYMVLAGILERFAVAADGYQFTVKGGVALELRIRERARATEDIDLVLHHPEMELVDAVEQAIAAPAPDDQGFRFQRRKEPLYLENGTVHVELAVTYRGGNWTTIAVDIAREEPGEANVELVDAIQFEDALGIAGPAQLPCLPLRYHVAQKLHGMTLPPRPGKRNERFKDLIDLMLMEALITDYRGLREACEEVFRARAKQGWPPPLELPEHWRAPYARLAAELRLPVTDAEEAMARVRALVARIETS
jgi:hypothetical protein